MSDPAPAPTLRGEGTLVLRPLAEPDSHELRRIRRTPAVRLWWGDVEEAFPWEEPDATRVTIELDGVVAGLIQFCEESDPRYRHATIDIFLDPAFHGRGVGTATLSLLVGYLLGERGHHRLTIDPAAANTPAIRCYRKVGFRPVGTLHAYERDVDGDGWHDALLMELVADGALARTA